MIDNQQRIENARKILVENDMGGYTVPTHGLYPFQWNWDAAITALGWATFDEARAWEEVQYLLKGQWDNGMIPHIVFHKEVDTYYPGADVWGTDGSPRTTSITQPAVLASVVKQLYDNANDKLLASQQLKELLPGIIAWHEWWYRERDPENTGLVVSYHPWESGMDNSPAWDFALAEVPPVSWQYERADLTHVDAEQRPHQKEYDRYLYLVDFFKHNNFDSHKIYQDSPYKVQDICLIAILHKATKDLLAVCKESGFEHAGLNGLAEKVVKTQAAIASLWHPSQKSFLSRDVVHNRWCEERTTGTLMALYAGLMDQKQAEMTKSLLQDWLAKSKYGIASTWPGSQSFEPQRYWRGPVWLHINWLVWLGIKEYGWQDLADEVKATSTTLITKTGFYEYFNCDTGEGCGGDKFSWTAAIAMHWLL